MIRKLVPVLWFLVRMSASGSLLYLTWRGDKTAMTALLAVIVLYLEISLQGSWGRHRRR